jgi:endonuclease/exonuclease/phosphatase family metal-dependent hydrolase
VQLTIVTFNIYNHEDFDERLPAILQTLDAARADVVCLQEVPPSGARTEAIARACGYANWAECVFVRPDDGWSEALAVLSRHRIIEQEPVDLRPGVPNCLRTVIDVAGGRVAVYNTHLHPRDSELRQREAALILDRMGHEAAVPAILCGDFNAVPAGRTMAVVWPQLRSAFEMAAGDHPETTFPTPLRPLAGRMPGFSERREAPATDDESEAKAAIDYVLVRPTQFHASEASVIGGAIDGHWPSDHYGIRVVLDRPL